MLSPQLAFFYLSTTFLTSAASASAMFTNGGLHHRRHVAHDTALFPRYVSCQLDELFVMNIATELHHKYSLGVIVNLLTLKTLSLTV